MLNVQWRKVFRFLVTSIKKGKLKYLQVLMNFRQLLPFWLGNRLLEVIFCHMQQFQVLSRSFHFSLFNASHKHESKQLSLPFLFTVRLRNDDYLSHRNVVLRKSKQVKLLCHVYLEQNIGDGHVFTVKYQLNSYAAIPYGIR